MRTTFVGLACTLLIGCATPYAVVDQRSAMTRTIEQFQSELPELSFAVPPVPSPAAREFFKYYGLMPTGVAHFYGTFRSEGRKLMAHVFSPENSQGSVILVHGYLDHAGIWKNLLSHLLSQQYTIAIYELSGHGLSSGDRVFIDCFSEYVTSIRDFVSLCRKNLNRPYHIVAHSLGAGVTADYLLSCRTDLPDGKTVLLAPLIRPAHALSARLGRAIVSPFCRSLPRVFRKNSSNKEFLQFVRDDPLQERHLPLDFAKAMRTWNRSLHNRPPTEREILVIQGASDSTVDFRYNLRVIKTKFPNADIELVPDAGHQLANESDALRSKVFDLIDACIQQETHCMSTANGVQSAAQQGLSDEESKERGIDNGCDGTSDCHCRDGRIIDATEVHR